MSTIAHVATGEGHALKFAKIDTATNGDTSVVAAVTGKKIKLVSWFLIPGGTVSVKWFSKDHTGTALSGAMPGVANVSMGQAGRPSSHLLETAVGEALCLNLSTGVQVSGYLSYFDDES